jgi:AraC family transcriptional regulator
MTTPLKKVQPAMAFAARHLDEDLSLAALAEQAGLSPFHLHRVFSAAAGETPKQYALRLRLDGAAVLLLTSRRSVLDVALSCGFGSHEVFCRVFRKRFRTTPSAYRTRGLVGGADKRKAARHAAVVSSAGPCIRLYRTAGDGRSRDNHMEYSITKKMLSPQPVLVATRRVKPSEIAKTLAETFPQIAIYAQQNGIALAGHPLTRYLDWGPGLMTMEPGMPVASHAGGASDGDVRADTLPGGFAATTIHAGPYDGLTDAHAAVQHWIEAQGLKVAGAPWESYLTDPADYPDPKDWKTELFWPLAD